MRKSRPGLLSARARLVCVILCGAEPGRRTAAFLTGASTKGQEKSRNGQLLPDTLTALLLGLAPGRKKPPRGAGASEFALCGLRLRAGLRAEAPRVAPRMASCRSTSAARCYTKECSRAARPRPRGTSRWSRPWPCRPRRPSCASGRARTCTAAHPKDQRSAGRRCRP